MNKVKLRTKLMIDSEDLLAPTGIEDGCTNDYEYAYYEE